MYYNEIYEMWPRVTGLSEQCFHKIRKDQRQWIYQREYPISYVYSSHHQVITCYVPCYYLGMQIIVEPHYV